MIAKWEIDQNFWFQAADSKKHVEQPVFSTEHLGGLKVQFGILKPQIAVSS